jgi:hypothetical protein
MKKILLTSVGLLGALTGMAQFTLISDNFESYALDAALDNIGTAKYDHTYGGAFDPAETGANMLGFYAGTGTNWVVKADPLDSGNKTLWLSGSDNPSQNGKGIYMMRLDPTGGGLYTSGAVTVSYSFRMMRDGADADSPTAFNVAWVSRPETLDNGSDNLDMFTWTGEEIEQSFVTSGNESAWVTVSGSITADLSTLDTTSPFSTGIRVYATNGGFVSGGQGIYFVDDFSVTVSAVPEPGTVGLLAGLSTLGLVLYRRSRQGMPK